MPNILIVDDSEVDRRIVGGLLEKLPDFQLQFAKNGRDAITQLRKIVPDLIVTDLQMPERDGLELVRAVRMHYSHVPIMLMTAHGSDELAIQALEEGAAGYVSKAQLGDRLVETVQDLLAITRADRSYNHLIGCLQRTVFQFSLDNDPSLLDPLIDLVHQIMAGMQLCPAHGRFRAGVALKAALLNALYRGNLELSSDELDSSRDGSLEGADLALVDARRQQSPYRERRIAVDITMGEGEARFVIRDEGPGFDAAAALAREPVESLDSGSGRGLVLMRTLVDEVRFNTRGNEVTLLVQANPSTAAE